MQAMTATESLKRIGKAPKPYAQRCLFGRAHTWVIPPFADEDQSFCVNCGCVSSIHPISKDGNG